MSITRGKIKLLALIVALSAMAAVAVVFYRFKAPQHRPVIALPESATNAILASTEVRHTATQNGKIQWELKADSAQVQNESREVILQSPDVIFFSDNGDKIELTAAQGVLNTRNNNLVVNGAVRLYNRQYAMHTEKLVYRHAERLLESQGKIKILGSAVQLQANAMTYNIETNQADFIGQVEGNIVEENDI